MLCSAADPSSSCIPHIVPIIRLYENPSPEIYPLQGGESPPHILSDESTKPENADGARMTTLVSIGEVLHS